MAATKTTIRNALLASVLVALILASVVDCLRTGAPHGACVTMTPHHNDPKVGYYAAQTGAAPFSIMSDVQSYNTNSTVRGTFSSNLKSEKLF